ncbi:TIGR00153 family protein [Paraferrimonas sedimenticola]|uniref:Phosphate transport regulator n=1 Tax=Paraferrimonas sedimenticola TaxID=375674 RepID=A0AA37VUI6_9GAMM|nr:TIGR00153 family protein [Paraferrimonas sedimenticola]GLP95681.1 phosphate transport regulator [Paraferrimonas sedimenticola]
MPVNSILGVFAKSPIKPLQEHINVVKECSNTLIPFLEAVIADDWNAANQYRDQISQLEKDADVIKRDLRMSLPGGLFMPVERTDILEVLTHQDKIANKAKDIAGRIIGREMSIPDGLEKSFLAYTQRCLDAVDQAHEAINELDELLESGFRGREVDLVTKMIQRLDRVEDDTDAMQIQLRRDLFKIEKQLNPIDVMFFYKIIEWTGDLADLAERVGSRLELMLARA